MIMPLPTTPKLRRRGPKQPKNTSTPNLARITFLFALCWPLIPYFFSPQNVTLDPIHSKHKSTTNLRKKGGETARKLKGKLMKMLQNYDFTGYGPHKPRIAVVVVGDSEDGLVRSVESVFRNTDRNRILTVVAILEGKSSSATLQSRLDSIDGGHTAHFHGLIQHSHHHDNPDQESHPDHVKDSHSKKIQVIFDNHHRSGGLNKSRLHGVEFVKLLVKQHENAGLKNDDENILLLFLRSDAALEDSNWIHPVTAALIPKDVYDIADDLDMRGLGEGDMGSRVPANAISFGVDYVDGIKRGDTTHAFDLALAMTVRDVQHSDNNAASKDSYPTPMVTGAATAMRLDVFAELPARDEALGSDMASDLEMSLNFWLCADGIDVVTAARVEVDPSFSNPKAEMSDVDTTRIAAAWMDQNYQAAVFNTRSTNTNTEPVSEYNRMALEASRTPSFPKDLQKKCRPFAWYAEHVHNDIFIEVEDQDETEEHKQEGNEAADAANHEEHVVVPAAAAQHIDTTTSKKSYLTEEEMQIIKQAKPQDIRFTNFSNGNKEHPHMGANDAQGNPGYIHDASFLINNPPPFTPPPKNTVCRKDNDYKMLTEKVVLDIAKHGQQPQPRQKIFCGVFTIPKYHDKLQSIRETWGKDCDGFIIASTETDPSLGIVNIPHEGPEEYNNIWQKMRSIWSYIYDNYYEDYDWFHLGGDDIYVLVENLRLYLESDEIQSACHGGAAPTNEVNAKNIQTPLFLGRRFQEGGNKERIFNSGGSGYTLNKAALKALIGSLPTCFPHMHTFAEDVTVASCLRKQGILPFPTRDENGGERYMPFAPGHHFGYRPPPPAANDWYPKYTVGELKVGLDHCAKDSLAFHYIKPDLQRRMYAILHGYCAE